MSFVKLFVRIFINCLLVYLIINIFMFESIFTLVKDILICINLSIIFTIFILIYQNKIKHKTKNISIFRNLLEKNEEIKYIGLANNGFLYGGIIIVTNLKILFKFNFPFSKKPPFYINLKDIVEVKSLKILTILLGNRVINVKTKYNLSKTFIIERDLEKLIMVK